MVVSDFGREERTEQCMLQGVSHGLGDPGKDVESGGVWGGVRFGLDMWTKAIAKTIRVL